MLRVLLCDLGEVSILPISAIKLSNEETLTAGELDDFWKSGGVAELSFLWENSRSLGG